MTRYIMAQDKTVRVRYSPLGTYFSLSFYVLHEPDGGKVHHSSIPPTLFRHLYKNF